MIEAPGCYELARFFLPKDADEELKRDLAKHIQESVDDWILMFSLEIRGLK
jgi:hypothetical protein